LNNAHLRSRRGFKIQKAKIPLPPLTSSPQSTSQQATNFTGPELTLHERVWEKKGGERKRWEGRNLFTIRFPGKGGCWSKGCN
jgi:hypothetical protein